jgi:hypothetical protein
MAARKAKWLKVVEFKMERANQVLHFLFRAEFRAWHAGFRRGRSLDPDQSYVRNISSNGHPEKSEEFRLSRRRARMQVPAPAASHFLAT